MAYIEGRDLLQGLSRHDQFTQQPIAGHGYPLADVLRWGVALCRTLEYLASKTPPVVHQDIKPANLILNQHSGELFLVDFGAARARLHVAAGSRTQTMVFGTPGYAAPEQYQGQSDTRSDVYALAATLYHLVTDDDPSTHPFEFPRLAYLGYLGPILRTALNPDRAQRPTALALREQIEALLAPESSRVLHAPDGVAITNDSELAVWCEQHWEAAAGWLYHGLPDHVQIAWVKLGLAENLRRCAHQHPNDRNAGLDAAIALLDRPGFGAAAPSLTTDSSAVELDRFFVEATRQAHGQLVIQNNGRRYARAAVALPRWLTIPTPSFSLIPGQKIALTLDADIANMPVIPQNAAVTIRVEHGASLAVPIQGRIPSARRSTSPRALLIIVALWLAFVCVIAVVWPMFQAVVAGR